MNAPAASAARSAAVAVAMDRIKAIEHEHGVTRSALDAILAEMLALAEHEALFPQTEFPPPPAGETGSRRYLLQGGPGWPLRALYAGAEPRQFHQAARPHHLGCRHRGRGPGTQRVYRPHRRRLGPWQSEPRAGARGHGRARPRHRADAGRHPLHPHLRHGADSASSRLWPALEKLDARQGFDPDEGTVQPYNKAFMKPTANR